MLLPNAGRQRAQKHGWGKISFSALHSGSLVPKACSLPAHPTCLTRASVCGMVTPSREPPGSPEHPKVLLHRLSHWVAPEGGPGSQGGSTEPPPGTIYPKHFNSVPPVYLSLLLFCPTGVQTAELVPSEASFPSLALKYPQCPQKLYWNRLHKNLSKSCICTSLSRAGRSV